MELQWASPAGVRTDRLVIGIISLLQILESGVGVGGSCSFPEVRTVLERRASDTLKLLLEHFPSCLMALS